MTEQAESKRPARVGAAIAVTFIVGFWVGHTSSPSGSASATQAAAPAPTYAAAQPAPQAADPAATGAYTAGTYTVGQEIKPGTYTTAGSDFCYWERDRDASGGLQSIIANDNVKGHGIMTVSKSDGFVKFDGDCTWTRK